MTQTAIRTDLGCILRFVAFCGANLSLIESKNGRFKITSVNLTTGGFREGLPWPLPPTVYTKHRTRFLGSNQVSLWPCFRPNPAGEFADTSVIFGGRGRLAAGCGDG